MTNSAKGRFAGPERIRKPAATPATDLSKTVGVEREGQPPPPA
jgi:hypothetical protein